MIDKTTTEFLNNPTFLGLVLLVFGVVIGYGGHKEWWVFGHEYRRVLRENAKLQTDLEHWQDVAMGLLGSNDRIARSVETILPPGSPVFPPPRRSRRRDRPDADA